ncbi:oxidoreductase-like protein [Patellaria atrata CBS 101060]|uniref:Oxidoreductase-like protein n=1 Tax=Patellaria atrata CBS 101060 TaxID=1346257 RepID=A0A9P4VVZ4_9PEZI|nr:oxidoreductase-like protein [Patellaria atrata CBS 101060]
MPVYFFIQGLRDGFGSLPYAWEIAKTIPWIALVVLLKLYFGGASNTSERNMHSKVVMITGGTSGIGAQVVKGLAARGAQLVLLTQHPLNDPFLVDYILDLREQTNNELITAEQVDLSSLHSIRLFATKWVDNAPPRRLDMIILCANTLTPPGGSISTTQDGLEASWGINYISNFHLLSILSPALRAQPPDRDVRVIFGTCSSYMGGRLPGIDYSDDPSNRPSKPKTKKNAAVASSPASTGPSAAYAASKLALMTFASAFQKHLSTYVRPDKQPMNTRVIVVDPGWTRTPGMRRYITFGSLWGLLVYLVTWPFWWLVLKSPIQGAQPFLWAAMDARLGHGEGGYFVKECREVRKMRPEIEDEDVQRRLWELSEKTVQTLEKASAERRAREKKEKGEKPVDAATKDPEVKKQGSRRSRKAG